MVAGMTTWLAEKSGHPTTPPWMGATALGFVPLCDAPGAYVLQQ